MTFELDSADHNRAQRLRDLAKAIVAEAPGARGTPLIGQREVQVFALLLLLEAKAVTAEEEGGRPTLTVGDVRDEFDLPWATAHDITQIAHRRGLVRCSRSFRDNRNTLIELTPKGWRARRNRRGDHREITSPGSGT